MIDILNKIYSVLKDDEKLMKILDIKNVKFNDYPDVKDITKPYVLMMISMILFPKYIMTENVQRIVILFK